MAQSLDDFYATISVGKEGQKMEMRRLDVLKMLMDAECKMGLADDVLSQLSVLNPGYASKDTAKYSLAHSIPSLNDRTFSSRMFLIDTVCISIIRKYLLSYR